ncbi:MAG: hypothetical protein SNJ78_03615 [Spirochaetales bacterium]
MDEIWLRRSRELLELSVNAFANKIKGSFCLSCEEVEAATLLLYYRLQVQMIPSLREQSDYREICTLLETIPLYSVKREKAEEFLATLSSIVGLPFRWKEVKEGEVVGECWKAVNKALLLGNMEAGEKGEVSKY